MTVLWFGARQVGPWLAISNDINACALLKDQSITIGSPCINTRDMAVQVVDGKLSAGQLSSFVIYALYVGTNVGALAGVISNLIQVSTRTLHLYFFMRPAILNVFACYPWMRVEIFWGCAY